MTIISSTTICCKINHFSIMKDGYQNTMKSGRKSFFYWTKLNVRHGESGSQGSDSEKNRSINYQDSILGHSLLLLKSLPQVTGRNQICFIHLSTSYMYNKEFKKYRDENTKMGLPNLFFFGIKLYLILDKKHFPFPTMSRKRDLKPCLNRILVFTLLSKMNSQI